MQLTELLDQLEANIARAYYLPLTSKALVDQNACLDLIDKIRAALPLELAEAQRIKRGRERILAQAEEEAADMRRDSQERLKQATAESEAVRLARVQADEIVAEGELQAREMAAAAVEYTGNLYTKLERDLAVLLDEVHERMPVGIEVEQ